MSSVEQRARELLAAEYQREGIKGVEPEVFDADRAALRAIAAALREQPEARGVGDEAIRSLAADMMTVVSEVDDIGALGSHVVAFANRLNALTGERNG